MKDDPPPTRPPTHPALNPKKRTLGGNPKQLMMQLHWSSKTLRKHSFFAVGALRPCRFCVPGYGLRTKFLRHLAEEFPQNGNSSAWTAGSHVGMLESLRELTCVNGSLGSAGMAPHGNSSARCPTKNKVHDTSACMHHCTLNRKHCVSIGRLAEEFPTWMLSVLKRQ